MLNDDTFFRIANEIAKHGTCSRLQVGAILVKENRIISTGFNGSPMGLEHCHHYDEKPCWRSVHSEMNCLVFAARHGISTLGTTMYTTTECCDGCAGPIINAGVSVVKFLHPYRNSNGTKSLLAAGLTVERYGEEAPAPTTEPTRPDLEEGQGHMLDMYWYRKTQRRN